MRLKVFDNQRVKLNYQSIFNGDEYNTDILLPIEEYLIIGHYSLKSNGFRYISSTISIFDHYSLNNNDIFSHLHILLVYNKKLII